MERVFILRILLGLIVLGAIWMYFIISPIISTIVQTLEVLQ